MLWLMRSNEDRDSLDILSYFIKASKRKKNAIFKIICSTKSLDLNFFGSKNLQTLILHPNSKAAVFFFCDASVRKHFMLFCSICSKRIETIN